LYGCTIYFVSLYLSGSRAQKKFNIITKIISKINVSIIYGTEKIYIYTVLENIDFHVPQNNYY